MCDDAATNGVDGMKEESDGLRDTKQLKVRTRLFFRGQDDRRLVGLVCCLRILMFYAMPRGL